MSHWINTRLNLRYHWKAVLVRGIGALFLVWTAATAHAAKLGIPGEGSTLSGVGVISGWKCHANGTLTVRFNGGDPIPLLYGSERTDVRANGQCLDNDHDNVGFVAIWNWGELGDGQHTAVVYDDGVEFDRSVFTVRRFRDAFVTGVSTTVSVQDFPSQGETAVFTWNQATQHLELAEAGSHVRPSASENSVEKWAEEQVDACYRKSDELGGKQRRYYRDDLRACLRYVPEVAFQRMWRDRYVRGLVEAITEAGGVEAWVLEKGGWQLCHPDGDINPDLADDYPDLASDCDGSNRDDLRNLGWW